MTGGERARVHVGDVLMACLVSVVAFALAPVVYDLVGDVPSGPLGELLLLLVVPMILLGIVISAGVSAEREV